MIDMMGIPPELAASVCWPIATCRVLSVLDVEVPVAAAIAACRTTARGTRTLDGYHAIARLAPTVMAEAVHVPADLVHRLAPPYIHRAVIGGRGHADAVTARRGDLLEVSGSWCRSSGLDAAPTRIEMPERWLVAAARDWPLVEALAELGVDGRRLVADALADPTGRAVAANDAAIRHLAALRREGAIARGEIAAELARLRADDDRIPLACWRARPMDNDAAAAIAELVAMPAAERDAVLAAMAEQVGAVEADAEAVEVPPAGHLPVGGSWGSGWVVADLSPVTIVRRRGEAKGA